MATRFYPGRCDSTPVHLRDQFLLDPDIVFLNHGSFGACPRPVLEKYQQWQRELERQLGITVLVGIPALFGLLAAAGRADPNLSNVPAHRHFINGVQVGPDLCDNPTNPGIQKAFNQFHNNLHRLTPDSIGPVAPGLHNGQGGEITPGAC